MAKRGTFADNARTLIRGGEVRTISLHNIRYELHANGEELWRKTEWLNELVGAVAAHPDGKRWVVWCDGCGEVSFAEKWHALEFLEVWGKSQQLRG